MLPLVSLFMRDLRCLRGLPFGAGTRNHFLNNDNVAGPEEKKKNKKNGRKSNA
jgi:hypothetical protein